MTNDEILSALSDLAVAAGLVIEEVYQTDFDVAIKGDGSAVTQADQRAEKVILEGLALLAPNTPVLAEEEAAAGNIPDLGDRFFLVDPLDGTREFVNRTGEFTVNIALIEEGAPILGVVYTPGNHKLYSGIVGQGAWLQMVKPGGSTIEAEPRKPIGVRKINKETLLAVASRSHRSSETEDYLTKIGATDFTPAGSSLKFCLIAEGQADVYPRLGRTMEWDTGAAHAVLKAAGGEVYVLEDGEQGAPLTYNKKDRGYDNPYFVAWGRQT